MPRPQLWVSMPRQRPLTVMTTSLREMPRLQDWDGMLRQRPLDAMTIQIPEDLFLLPDPEAPL